MIFLPIFCSFFSRFLARYYFKFCSCFWILYVLLPCSFAGEEFAGEEEEEVTGEALAYIAGEEEEVAGEEFTGASERRKEKP